MDNEISWTNLCSINSIWTALLYPKSHMSKGFKDCGPSFGGPVNVTKFLLWRCSWAPCMESSSTIPCAFYVRRTFGSQYYKLFAKLYTCLYPGVHCWRNRLLQVHHCLPVNISYLLHICSTCLIVFFPEEKVWILSSGIYWEYFSRVHPAW
jgi:hypothetical protein